MSVAAIICGMPSSGNRLVSRLMQAHDVPWQIFHWWDERGQVAAWRREGLIVKALWLHRDEAAHRASCERVGHFETKPRVKPCFASYEENVAAHYPRTHAGLAALEVETLLVSYSRLVAEPDAAGRRIAEWLGVDWRGWPEEVYDADAKYRGGGA